MSPEDRTLRVLAELAGEIRRDLEAIAGAQQLVTEELGRVGPEGPSVPQLAFSAFHIERIYSTREAALARVARMLDRRIPAGVTWHIELLRQITMPVPEVRPAVLGTATAEGLEDLLRFRHFVRHAYRVDLDWQRLQPLVAGLAVTLDRVRNDLQRFASGLAPVS